MKLFLSLCDLIPLFGPAKSQVGVSFVIMHYFSSLQRIRESKTVKLVIADLL